MGKLGNPFNLNNNDCNTLEDYLNLVDQNKKDMYGIEEQFYSWYNSKLNFPILFMNFNKVLEKKDTIDKFLSKRLDYTSFVYQEKKSSLKNIREPIVHLYNKLYNKMDKDSELTHSLGKL
jgi:hypothetical protein